MQYWRIHGLTNAVSSCGLVMSSGPFAASLDEDAVVVGGASFVGVGDVAEFAFFAGDEAGILRGFAAAAMVVGTQGGQAGRTAAREPRQQQRRAPPRHASNASKSH